MKLTAVLSAGAVIGSEQKVLSAFCSGKRSCNRPGKRCTEYTISRKTLACAIVKATPDAKRGRMALDKTHTQYGFASRKQLAKQSGVSDAFVKRSAQRDGDRIGAKWIESTLLSRKTLACAIVQATPEAQRGQPAKEKYAQHTFLSRKELAAQAGVSEVSVKEASAVHRADPALFAEVLAGDDINDLEARIATLSRDKVRDPGPSPAPEQPDRADSTRSRQADVMNGSRHPTQHPVQGRS